MRTLILQLQNRIQSQNTRQRQARLIRYCGVEANRQSQKEPKRVPSEEYIIVEEEIEEDETPRPRGRVRERVVEKIEVDRYPSRPCQSSQRLTSRQESHKILRKPVRPAKIRETVVHETIRRRLLLIEYVYVDA
jgi:hypothetical protein